MEATEAGSVAVGSAAPAAPVQSDPPRSSGKRKRRADDSSKPKNKRKNTGDDVTSSLSSAAELPVNTDGSRFTATEPDPHNVGPERSCRPARFDRVSFSAMDRAPQLKINDDWMEMTGEKGYCMARGTHGVSAGKWYFEFEVLQKEQLPEKYPDAAWRLGWAQLPANLQGPVGLDVFSYSWRSVKGDKFHLAKGDAYGEGYKPGDVIGFFIDLPGEPIPTLVRPKREFLVSYKNKYYYEQVGVDKVDMSQVHPRKGSSIVGYKNGVNQGVMFTDITAGKYFPAASLYMGARVRINVGPDFKFPPKDQTDFSPLCDVVHYHNAELTMADCITKVVKAFMDAGDEAAAAANASVVMAT